MSKDPAFLFYSKDWLEGTAEMMPNEKGVYIDLLCYQHQRGDLPNDTKRLARMVGLSVDEFEEIWNVISDKFEANGERTLNRKLSEVMSERKDKGHTNKIIGLFGGLCKKCELTFDQLAPVRKDFKVANFKQYSSDEVSERLSEWFNERIALLEDGNVDVDVINNESNKGVIFSNNELNEVFNKWLKMLDERQKPMTQSSIEALAMKLNRQPVEYSIKQIEQSLENNWLTLRAVDIQEQQSEKDMQAGQIMKELKRQALEESLYGENRTEQTKRVGNV